MADVSGASAGNSQPAFVVPQRTRDQFPELVNLVMSSESMNDEERRYWIDMLPVMMPEQLEQLNKILANERQQLAAIDEKYGKKIQEMTAPPREVAEIQAERRDKSNERKSREAETREQETTAAEQMLQELE